MLRLDAAYPSTGGATLLTARYWFADDRVRVSIDACSLLLIEQQTNNLTSFILGV